MYTYYMYASKPVCQFTCNVYTCTCIAHTPRRCKRTQHLCNVAPHAARWSDVFLLGGVVLLLRLLMLMLD